jgi:hypothetical protein
LDEHTGAVGVALRNALLQAKEKHPEGSGLTTAIDLAHRIMGLSAWTSNEVTPVMHMSFGLMFLYATTYEKFAVESPAKYGFEGVCAQTIRQRINEDVRNLAKLKNQNGKVVSHDAAKGIKVWFPAPSSYLIE